MFIGITVFVYLYIYNITNAYNGIRVIMFAGRRNEKRNLVSDSCFFFL